jgi:hypothetical protein
MPSEENGLLNRQNTRNACHLSSGKQANQTSSTAAPGLERGKESSLRDATKSIRYIIYRICSYGIRRCEDQARANPASVHRIKAVSVAEAKEPQNYNVELP